MTYFRVAWKITILELPYYYLNIKVYRGIKKQEIKIQYWNYPLARYLNCRVSDFNINVANINLISFLQTFYTSTFLSEHQNSFFNYYQSHNPINFRKRFCRRFAQYNTIATGANNYLYIVILPNSVYSG